jgi:hypothetical protein
VPTAPHLSPAEHHHPTKYAAKTPFLRSSLATIGQRRCTVARRRREAPGVFRPVAGRVFPSSTGPLLCCPKLMMCKVRHLTLAATERFLINLSHFHSKSLRCPE